MSETREVYWHFLFDFSVQWRQFGITAVLNWDDWWPKERSLHLQLGPFCLSIGIEQDHDRMYPVESPSPQDANG